jgi:predicted MFS family arabinose efflux permease
MMSAIAEPTRDAAAGDGLARRNVLVLAIAQALSGGNNTVIVSTGGIVGAMLAPDKAFATVPISVMVLGMWAGTLPVGMLSKLFGRRVALQTGALVGAVSGLICCWAVIHASFSMFLAGAFGSGLYAAAHQSYRFAAADTASEAFKPKAVSWVLAGGVFAGVLGAQLVIFTKDIWQPYLFAATYIGQATFALLTAMVLALVKIPRHAAAHGAKRGRPLGEIVRTPRFITAVVCGVASYSMMNLVMTSAPLAMVDCGHSVTTATLGLQWHVLAMFGPSFFTGSVIARFGMERVILSGLAMIGLAAIIAMSGITVAHFWAALILLGIGWNFAFIGATTMVTRCHRPEERNQVQAFNDFLIFGSMAVGSFASGTVLANFGWSAVNEVVFPAILVAGALLVWWRVRERTKLA